MGHIVLLGDSVFDNLAYVRPGEPDVVRQLRGLLPAGWGATLAAVDGAVTGGVRRQLERVPPGATALPSCWSLAGMTRFGQAGEMTSDTATYPGHRFPAEIISHAVRPWCMDRA